MRHHSMLTVLALIGTLPPREEVHEHEPLRTETRAFQGCVSSSECRVDAHQGVAEHQTCSCGAIRIVNVNDGHIERGPWVSLREQR